MSAKVPSPRPFPSQKSPTNTPPGSDSNGNEADIEKSYSEGQFEPRLPIKVKQQDVEKTETDNLSVTKPRSYSTGSTDSRETCLHIPRQQFALEKARLADPSSTGSEQVANQRAVIGLRNIGRESFAALQHTLNVSSFDEHRLNAACFDLRVEVGIVHLLST